MALEKITIATEEKQDKILQNFSIVLGQISQLAQETSRTEHGIEQIKTLVIQNDSAPLLQIKTGNYTEETNCRYLLIGVTKRNGISIFDSLKATDTSGSSVTRNDYNKYITDKTTRMGDKAGKIGNKTFYLLREALIVTQFDMYGSESALMLKLPE